MRVNGADKGQGFPRSRGNVRKDKGGTTTSFRAKRGISAPFENRRGAHTSEASVRGMPVGTTLVVALLHQPNPITKITLITVQKHRHTRAGGYPERDENHSSSSKIIAIIVQKAEGECGAITAHHKNHTNHSSKTPQLRHCGERPEPLPSLSSYVYKDVICCAHPRRLGRFVTSVSRTDDAS